MTRDEMLYVIERYVNRLEYAVSRKVVAGARPRDEWIDAVEACDKARADLLEIVRGAIVLSASP
jgi:hypothetical protein